MKIRLLSLVFIGLFLFINPSFADSDPADAVVRMPSHGGSATVIFTEPGRSLLLSCGHCFTGSDRQTGRSMRSVPVRFDIPSPNPSGTPKKVNIQVLAVDPELDLSLIEMDDGPLPYVAPVVGGQYSPVGHWIISCGYDEMKTPKKETATLIRTDEMRTIAREPPWHGRSGGGLIDVTAGVTIGVVSGYENPYPRGNGIYVSRYAIHDFMKRSAGLGNGLVAKATPADLQSLQDQQQQQPAPRPRPGVREGIRDGLGIGKRIGNNPPRQPQQNPQEDRPFPEGGQEFFQNYQSLPGQGCPGGTCPPGRH